MSPTLTVRICNHRGERQCRCDRLHFPQVERPLLCAKSEGSSCYGYPLGFVVENWLDTMWGRLFMWRCSECGYTVWVSEHFMGPAYLKEVN